MHPRKIIRDFAGYAGSQYIVRVLLVMRGVVAARLLGPAAWGAWNGLSLFLEYGLQSQLGTLQGLDQAVPPRIVAGDAAALVRVKRAGVFNILTFGLALVGLGALYFLHSTGSVRHFWGERGVVLALVASMLINLSNLHNSILRSHGEMMSVSGGSLLQGLIGAVLGLALIPWIGAWGLLWGWIAGTIALLVFVRVRGGRYVPLAPQVSSDSRRLIGIGFPMFAYASITLVMRSLDRLVILRFFPIESLGFYAIAVMAINMLMYLPDSLAYVLYPRLLARYHEAGQDPEAVRDMVERALRLVSLVLPLFCALAYLVADDSVMWVLPRYRDGVPALRILCFGAAALGLGSLSSVILMTLGRQRVLVPVSLGTTLVGAALMLAAVHLGFGIRGVAWATLATYALHSAAMVWFALGGLHENAWRRLLYLVRLVSPLLLAIVFAWSFNSFLPWPLDHGSRGVLRLAMGLALFLVSYLLAAVPLARGIGLRQLALEFRLPGLARLRNRFGGRP